MLQKSLLQFEKFSQKSDFPIALSKSKIIEFLCKQNNGNTRLTLNGIIISEDNQINYLGLILGQKLNFDLHMINTMKKCLRKIRIIEKLLTRAWRCNEKTLLQFYKSHVTQRTSRVGWCAGFGILCLKGRGFESQCTQLFSLGRESVA